MTGNNESIKHGLIYIILYRLVQVQSLNRGLIEPPKVAKRHVTHVNDEILNVTKIK